MSSRNEPKGGDEEEDKYDPNVAGSSSDSRRSQGIPETFYLGSAHKESIGPPTHVERQHIQHGQYGPPVEHPPKSIVSEQYSHPWGQQLHFEYPSKAYDVQPEYDPEVPPREEPEYSPSQFGNYASSSHQNPDLIFGEYRLPRPSAPGQPYVYQPQATEGFVNEEEMTHSSIESLGKEFPSIEGQINLELDAPGQRPPVNGPALKISTNAWESETTLYITVEAKGVSLTRRLDNNLINGTKLLNYTGATRGRRDGILKSEKVRHVIRIGNQNLKGVWIPFERAFMIGQASDVCDELFPLFLGNIEGFLYSDQNITRTRQVVKAAMQHSGGFKQWLNGIPRKRKLHDDPHVPDPGQHALGPPFVQQSMEPQFQFPGQASLHSTGQYYQDYPPLGNIQGKPSTLPIHQSRSGPARRSAHRRGYSVDKTKPLLDPSKHHGRPSKHQGSESRHIASTGYQFSRLNLVPGPSQPGPSSSSSAPSQQVVVSPTPYLSTPTQSSFGFDYNQDLRHPAEQQYAQPFHQQDYSGSPVSQSTYHNIYPPSNTRPLPPSPFQQLYHEHVDVVEGDPQEEEKSLDKK